MGSSAEVSYGDDDSDDDDGEAEDCDPITQGLALGDICMRALFWQQQRATGEWYTGKVQASFSGWGSP